MCSSSWGPGGAVGAVLARWGTVLDELAGLDWSCLSRDELLTVTRQVEVLRRRASVVDHALVAESDGRGVSGEVGCASTAALLVGLLRVAPAEATGRVRAAADLGPRYGLGGEPLGPLFPAVAAGQADGMIGDRHAAVIRAAVDALPDRVQAVHDRAVETALVQHARTLDPVQLGPGRGPAGGLPGPGWRAHRRA